MYVLGDNFLNNSSVFINNLFLSVGIKKKKHRHNDKAIGEVTIFHSLRPGLREDYNNILSMYTDSAAFCLSRPAPAYLNVNVQRRLLRRLRSSSGLLPLAGRRPYRFARRASVDTVVRDPFEKAVSSRGNRSLAHVPCTAFFDSAFRFSWVSASFQTSPRTR